MVGVEVHTMSENHFSYASVPILPRLNPNAFLYTEGQERYLEVTDKHMLVPVVPSMTSRIPYIELSPLSGHTMQRISAFCRDQKLDALLLGVYDSGLVPDEVIPPIAELSAEGVPVFGIRQTLFQTPSISFSFTSDQLGALHHIQPETVAAGITPLQAYFPEMYAIADAIRAFSVAYGVGNLTVTESKIPALGGSFGDVMQHHVFTGLDAICQQYSGYAERVSAAKEKFSTPAFNQRIENVIAQVRS
jgi:hypothetical protein